MWEEERKLLAGEALEQLWVIPHLSWSARGKRLVRKYLLHQLTEPVDHIPWPKGCLLMGLAQQGMYDEVLAYFDLWIKKGAKLYTLDDLLAGQALLLADSALCSFRQSRHYEMKLHAMMGFLYAHPKDGQGSFPYRPLHGTDHIYADGIGMVCPFAVGYGVKYRDKEAVKLALKQVRSFMQSGIDKETGLPYHAYRYCGSAEPQRLGAVGWGRAVGWILYGLGMSLYFLRKEPSLFPEEEKELFQMAEKLAEVVLPYRNKEGLFGSFLCDPASPTDTSGTAMILHGLCMLSGENFRAVCDEALGALQKYCREGKVFQAQSECISLSQYGDRYDSFPWSVGMTLSLLVLS